MATSYFTDDGKRLTPDTTPVPGIEKPWVVVTDAGTDNEFEWSEHYSFGEALKVKQLFGESSADAMKRRADGSRTTEF